MSYTNDMAEPPSLLAERVWLAIHALPRDEHGRPPTHAALEREGKLNKATFYKILRRGQADAEGDTLEKLADVLRVSIDWLKSGRGSPPSPTGLVEPPPWTTRAESLSNVELAAEALRRDGMRISLDAEREIATGSYFEPSTFKQKDWQKLLIEAQANLDKRSADEAYDVRVNAGQERKAQLLVADVAKVMRGTKPKRG